MVNGSKNSGPKVGSGTETRERIFRAVKTIACRQGIEGLTTKRVCEEAGVSNGTFFYHFKSKNELLSYFLQEGFDEYYARHRAQIENGGDPCAQVIAGFLLYADYCDQTGVDFMRAYYVGSNAALDGRPEALGRSFLNQQMKDAAAALSCVAGERAADIARGCCTVVKGCVFEWCVAAGHLNLSAHVRTMLKAYLAGALNE